MKNLKLTAFFLAVITIILFCFSTETLAVDILEDELETTSLENEPVFTNEDIASTISDQIQARGESASSNEEKETVHKGDLYIVGNSSQYVMDRVVDGNLFFFGNDLKITGQVNGSIFAFAANIEVEEDAYIACHTFAFADNVNFKGSTYDAYIACGDLKLGDKAAIYRDLRVFASYTYLAGTIGRNVILYGETVECTDVENGLNIRGNITYEAKEEIANLNKASIVGDAKFVPMKEKKVENAILDYVWSATQAIVFNVILYMILAFLAPNFVKKSKEYASTKSLLAFGVGVAFTILIPIIAIVLLLTVIGVRFIILHGFCIRSSTYAKYFNCCSYFK